MSFRLKRWLGAMLGTLVLGCGLTEAGPVVVRIIGIDVDTPRLALQLSQAADLTLNVTTSREDSGAAANSIVWSTTGGVITNNYFVDGVRHITYQAPNQPGDYLFVVTTVTGAPADTARIAVTTAASPVHTVSVTPGSLSLAVNDTSRLSVTLKDSTGAVVVGRAIDWSTSDAGVVTVLATGQVRGVGAGSATITATCEGKLGTAAVTVSGP